MARATAKTKPSGMDFRPVSIAERNAALAEHLARHRRADLFGQAPMQRAYHGK